MQPSLTLETTWGCTLRAFCLGLVLLGFLPSLRAQQFGLFSYRILGDAVEITGYPWNAIGHVEIPAVIDGLPVIRIGEGAFSGYTGLTSVIIPEGVTDIGIEYWDTVGAFSGCTGLTNISLPSSLTSIGVGTFFGCTGLTAINVEAGNPTYASESGVLLDAKRARLILCPQGKVGHYSIPASVTAIGDWTFWDRTGLTSVTIPASVTAIGEYAFSGCTGLTNLTLEQGFTTIGSSMFAGCTGLTSVTIPSSVRWIGSGAFSGCTRLGSFVVAPGNTVYSSVEGALLNAAQTALVLFPQGKAGHYGIPSSVTSIASGAFGGCTGLTSVTFPSSVTSIASGAFGGCTGLTSVTLPSNLTSIGNSTFHGCTGLTNVTIPARVTSIGDYAFYGCNGLTSVSIPSSVTSIGECAFYSCTGLTSVTFHEGLTTIEGFAFSGCTGLTSVTIPASVTHIGPFHYIYGNIYAQAFSRCTALTRAVFLGNAPAIAVGDANWSPLGREFEGAAPGFTIYYLSSRTGFTSPTWNGYPAIRIDEATYPAASWLLSHGLGYDTQLNQDPDGDGVNLLTAYALNLDPRLNLRGRLPGPLLGADTLSLNFHASSPGITYRVETSTNLTHWTTTGVTQTAPGTDGRSTASVLRDAPQRFLRLSLQD